MNQGSVATTLLAAAFWLQNFGVHILVGGRPEMLV